VRHSAKACEGALESSVAVEQNDAWAFQAEQLGDLVARIEELRERTVPAGCGDAVGHRTHHQMDHVCICLREVGRQTFGVREIGQGDVAAGAP
jgi:hypothetical protein